MERRTVTVRAGCKKLTGDEVGFGSFAEATWRLMFRLFASPNQCQLHRLFALVLLDLSTINESNAVFQRQVACAEMRLFVDALGDPQTASMARMERLRVIIEQSFLLRVRQIVLAFKTIPIRSH
jgi:hypothetical protein